MRIVRIGLIVTTVALVALATGCATFISGTTQTITIRSNPSGAHVQYGNQSGNTPVMLQVPKGKDDPIEVTYGRNRQVIVLSRTVDPNTYLNLIPPLWPGFIVDALTGAMTEYETNEVMVDFKRARMVRYAR